MKVTHEGSDCSEKNIASGARTFEFNPAGVPRRMSKLGRNLWTRSVVIHQ